MSTEGTITINKKEYPYKFGMKQIRVYMQDNKLKTMTEYWNVFTGLEAQTPEYFVQVAKVLRSGIKALGPIKGLPKDNDDLVDTIFASGSLQEVLAALMASFPRVKEEPAPSGKS